MRGLWSFLVLLFFYVQSQANLAPATGAAGLSERLFQKLSTQFLVENNSLQIRNLETQKTLAAVTVARGQLLPQLNIWRWLSVFFEPGEILFSSQTFVPFLVPANWFRLKESKVQVDVEQIGQTIFQAQSLLQFRVQVVKTVADHLVFRSLKEQKDLLNKQLSGVALRGLMGAEELGVALGFEVDNQILDSDLADLNLILGRSKMALLMSLNRPPEIEASPVLDKIMELGDEFLADLSLNQIPRVKLPAFEIQKSREYRQYLALKKQLNYAKRPLFFGLFGLSPLERASSLGVFDDLPVQDGLGFGSPASLRIGKGEQERLRIYEKFLTRQLFARDGFLRSTLEQSADRLQATASRRELAIVNAEENLIQWAQGGISSVLIVQDSLRERAFIEAEYRLRQIEYFQVLENLKILLQQPPYDGT